MAINIASRLRGVSARTPWNPIAADCVIVHDELEPIAAVPSLPSAASGVASAVIAVTELLLCRRRRMLLLHLLWRRREVGRVLRVCLFFHVSCGGDRRWGEL
ncbi:hypothetical protein TIFTF001_046206 [Ficus carica]|uniref:Uncharacterized protein n=1 Tax=Ficus carica TaxID=3494 RepID=A0AA87ZB17_FICCA|nr:hypothetical protein TIFTF001_046206 [Ficus carica]